MNRIKLYLNSLGQGTRVLILSLAVIFVGAGVAQATSSTIGTDITTTGNLSVTGTAAVTGIATFVNASTTNFSVLTKASFGSTATSSFNSAGDLTLAGTLKVGTSGTAQTQVVFGYCNTDATSIAVANPSNLAMGSTTVTYRDCVPATAVTFTSGSRVFVQATSSLPANILVQSASTTASNGHISVGFLNTSTSTASTAIYALNFWAVQ